jgi:dethiobiotin synthetase
MNVFITGTDTGVGKTYVTALLLRALATTGREVAGYKPVVCGERDDVALLLAASSAVTAEQINPCWLQTPACPAAAAAIENRTIDRELLSSAYSELARCCDTVLVEGAGGWEVPLAAGVTMADLAVQFALPVVVVVDNRLGALNHTLLTVAAIAGRGLTCAGVILNHTADERDVASLTNRRILEDYLDVPVLFEVLCGEDALDPLMIEFLDSA